MQSKHCCYVLYSVHTLCTHALYCSCDSGIRSSGTVVYTLLAGETTGVH
jgi:hypothetical protein